MKSLKILSLAATLVLFSGLSDANSQTIRQFKDWRAMCDASGNCKGVAVDTRRNNTQATYRLEIARKTGRDAFWTISFVIIGDEPRTYEPFHVSVDFEPPLQIEPDEGYQVSVRSNTYDLISTPKANGLMTLFASGNRAFFNFLNTRGQETAARFSLKGFKASLLWIDEQQNRLQSPRLTGDVDTASRETGTGQANPFTSGNSMILSPDRIPPAIGKLHFSDGECNAADRPPLEGFGFETDQVGKENTLYLIPCFAGAYNIVYRAYLKSNNDTARQLLFARYSDETGWTGTKDLMNISYNAKNATLAAFSKARGLGDCGSTSRYKWTGHTFKMMQYRYWGKCDGTRLPDDWPTIYPAAKRK